MVARTTKLTGPLLLGSAAGVLVAAVLTVAGVVVAIGLWRIVDLTFGKRGPDDPQPASMAAAIAASRNVLRLTAGQGGDSAVR